MLHCRVVKVLVTSAANGLPATSVTPDAPPLMVKVWPVSGARVGAGFSVTVRPFVLRVSDVATTVPEEGPDETLNSKLAAFTVVGFTASLKVTERFAVRLTPVAPLAGDVDVTVGGVVSIVNDQTLSTAMATP